MLHWIKFVSTILFFTVQALENESTFPNKNDSKAWKKMSETSPPKRLFVENFNKKLDFYSLQKTHQRFRRSLFNFFRTKGLKEITPIFPPRLRECRIYSRSCPEWTEWVGSNFCSTSCGGGKTIERRYCKNGDPHWDCFGNSSRESECNTQSCPIWSSWSSATPCSQTCGEGQIIKERICSSRPGECKGPERKLESCSTPLLCPPEWSQWSELTPCSVSCGIHGFQRRTRQCLNTNNSLNCIGSSYKTYSCNPNVTCPIKYSHWITWNVCDVECGRWTTITRTRRCLISPCLDDALKQRKVCGREECSNTSISTQSNSNHNKNLSIHRGWSSWSSCSTSCGESGIQLRAMNCSIHNSTWLCENKKTESRSCNHSRSCPSWGSWNSWESCLGDCDKNEGKRLRFRKCFIRKRSFNETTSSSQNEENEETVDTGLCGSELAYQNETCSELSFCNSNLMEWFPWSSWSPCSSSYGPGLSVSLRSCNSSGNCFGKTKRYKTCFSPPTWGVWTDYTPCTTSCGKSGMRTRQRKCLGVSPIQSERRNCEGNSSQSQPCNVLKCPRWGSWSSAESCSQTCGGGRMTYTRTCLQGSCKGESVSHRDCNEIRCPTWSSWTGFGCCTASCGGGNQTRTRRCLYGSVGDIGCDGENEEVRPCNRETCNLTQTTSMTPTCGRKLTRNAHMTLRKRALLKIIGGERSYLGSWPWQGSLQVKVCDTSSCWVHICGATLIAVQWALSAAHCTEDIPIKINNSMPQNQISLVFGSVNLRNEQNEIRVRASRIILHPSYSNGHVIISNDIELIQLEHPVTYSSKVFPACLPGSNLPGNRTLCYITGWGNVNRVPSLVVNNRLQEARVPILNLQHCRRLGRDYEHLNEDNHICAGNPETADVDSCEGDSGGPLSCQDPSGNWFVAGITSFGLGRTCGLVGHVGIYLPVHRFQDWINNVITTCFP